MEHLKIAFSQYGVEEINGGYDNPEVLKYFDALGYDGAVLKDETAWCAAFACWVLKMAGLPQLGKLNARSFLNVGKPTKTPKPGDVVVLWRGDRHGWRGHVGFYINETKDHINILGGNQMNKVCILPYSKYRLLEYRSIA